jgi:hypothetical protein
MWSKIRFELLWSQGQAIGRIKEKYTSCIGSLEGDASSAPVFPARQRGIVCGNGAGLRLAKMGRHGGRPSEKCHTERKAIAPFENLGGRCSVGAHFSRATARPC